jgi:hypothetical protein
MATIWLCTNLRLVILKCLDYFLNRYVVCDSCSQTVHRDALGRGKRLANVSIKNQRRKGNACCCVLNVTVHQHTSPSE